MSKLSCSTDNDLKQQTAKRIEAGEPRATYIKRLIREDIKRNSENS